MSQIFVPLASSNPTVPTQFNTDNGNAVPVANILLVHGLDSSENNPNGLIIKGGTPATPNTNEVDVVITNRLHNAATVTTVGATTATIISATAVVGPNSVGTYVYEVRVAAFNTTLNIGAGYQLFGAVRFDGANFTNCDPPDKVENQEGSMNQSDATISATGATISVTGTGYVGSTINWSAVATYTFIGAV